MWRESCTPRPSAVEATQTPEPGPWPIALYAHPHAAIAGYGASALDQAAPRRRDPRDGVVSPGPDARPTPASRSRIQKTED